jgi:hypothetical protein
MKGKSCRTPSSISAHTAGASIGIIVAHEKIRRRTRLQENEPVSTHTEMTRAEGPCKTGVVGLQGEGPIVDQDKIISRAGCLPEIDSLSHTVSQVDKENALTRDLMRA